jgi:peptide/nickel transport system substrate-binding protein
MADRTLQTGFTRRQFLEFGAATAAAVGVTVASGDELLSSAAAATVPTKLRVGWNSPPDLMNPFTYESTASGEIIGLIYDSLTEYDINLKVVPSLAESETPSNDGRTFTYKLRSGSTWHDGKPVTSADVKYTYDTLAKNDVGQFGWTLAEFKSCEIVDPLTVVVNYKVAQAWDPAPLIKIVPEHIWGKFTPKELASYTNPHPVGSGPFTFSSWVVGQTVQVDRYPHWWGTLPAVPTVIWEQFENSDVMVKSLEQGDIDIITEVPTLLWKSLKGKSDVDAISMESFSFHHIGFNVSQSKKSGANPLIRDLNVRKALAYALDRQQLVDLCLASYGKPGSVLLPPSFGMYQAHIPADQQFNDNPAKASSILDAAGYAMGSGGIRNDKQGNPLSFRLICVETTDEDVLAGQIFVERAKEIGVELTLDPLDATTLGNIVYDAAAPNWDIFIWGWDSASPDPDYLMSIELTSQIGGNADVFYSNQQYDAWYTEQAETLNVDKRATILHEMQKLFYDDAAYCIMWYQSKLQAYRTDTWKGWVETRGGVVYNFTRSNYLTIKPV